jgi:hypothetical protein
MSSSWESQLRSASRPSIVPAIGCSPHHLRRDEGLDQIELAGAEGISGSSVGDRVRMVLRHGRTSLGADLPVGRSRSLGFCGRVAPGEVESEFLVRARVADGRSGRALECAVTGSRPPRQMASDSSRSGSASCRRPLRARSTSTSGSSQRCSRAARSSPTTTHPVDRRDPVVRLGDSAIVVACLPRSGGRGTPVVSSGSRGQGARLANGRRRGENGPGRAPVRYLRGPLARRPRCLRASRAGHVRPGPPAKPSSRGRCR